MCCPARHMPDNRPTHEQSHRGGGGVSPRKCNTTHGSPGEWHQGSLKLGVMVGAIKAQHKAIAPPIYHNKQTMATM